VDEIRDNITKVLNSTLPDIANKLLEKNDGFISFPWKTHFVTFDWESPQQAVNVTDTYLGLGTKGLFFENGAGEVAPNVPIPAMPYRPTTAPIPGLNLFASTYSIDSFFTALLDAQPIAGWYNSTSVTAGELDIALPGISKHYGSNQTVFINYDLKNITDTTIKQKSSTMGAYFTLDLNFWVNTTNSTVEEAASITLQHTDFSFDLDIQNMTASMLMDTVNVDKILINSCSFGKLSPFTMKLKLNNGWRIAKPTVNRLLKGHSITVPSKPTKYFEISNLQLSYYDNYLGVGLTPTFIGPTAADKMWFSHIIEQKRSAHNQAISLTYPDLDDVSQGLEIFMQMT